MLFAANNAISQTVFEDWVQGTGSQNYFLKSTVKTDANRNVYQTGATISSAGDYDVIVTKYNPRGEEIWTQTYDVAGYDDAAVDLFIDDYSNVYLAGTTFNPSNSGYQVLVLKYNASGTFLWDDVYAYPNSLYNLATSITGHGNSIYIGGATYNITNQADYLALSYTATGTMIWNYSWNNVSYNDVITKIHLAGNTISLAGGTQIDSDKWEYGLVNLDASTGNFQMQKISGGSGAGIDKITDLTRDNAGNKTGLSNSEDQTFLTIWPNPTNSAFTINSISISNNITIFDISGRIIQEFDNQSNQTEIDVSRYPSGVYLIKVENDQGVFSKKVVKL